MSTSTQSHQTYGFRAELESSEKTCWRSVLTFEAEVGTSAAGNPKGLALRSNSGRPAPGPMVQILVDAG